MSTAGRLVSTVPGAIGVLYTHFQAVATANPALHPGVYLGMAVGPGQSSNNYLQIGNWQTGSILSNYKQDFRALPVAGTRKNEDYVIPCNLRAWAGTAPPSSPTAPQTRLTEAFTLLDGVFQKLQTDPAASGTIATGTWQVTAVTIPKTGPFGDAGGWGVLLAFDVHVFNVTIPVPY